MIRLKIPQVTLIFVALMAFAITSNAEVPKVISYQGRLTDTGGNPVPDGDYELTFQIVEHNPMPMGESPLWSSGAQTVTVKDGLFVYYLGSNVSLPADIFNDNGLDSYFLRIRVEGSMLFMNGTELVTVPFAVRSIYSDTAAYALAGPGGGSSGWVDDGSVVRLDNAGDLVGIGTTTPNERLVVGKDMGSLYGDFVVAGNPEIDGTSGFTAGYDIDNRGWFSWDNEEKEFQIGVRSNGTNTPNSIYLGNGNVGIGNSFPSEPLSVGNSVGSYPLGNMITVGDSRSDGIVGMVFGQDPQNNGFLAFDNSNKFAFLGTAVNGMYHSYEFVLKSGNVGVGTIPPDTATMTVNGAYNELALLEKATGIASKITSSATNGIIHGGQFYADGGRHPVGIRVEAYNGFLSETACIIRSDHLGLDVAAPTAADMTGLVFIRDDTYIYGNLTKTSGSFRIDHPLDPANKYLQHSFVESPDMMNIYNGNVITDENGLTEVILPDYFEALNMDFRYQLTVIGEFAQAIIGEKIKNGRFTIRTDKPNVEVSWQVTGIRQDPWANEHRIEVEVDKPEDERGYFIAPELYGLGNERSVHQNLYGNREHDLK